MSQMNAPDVRVWTVIKADEKDVGISDVRSDTNYAGQTVIRTNNRIERSWKCWVRDEDTGEESWFQGSGNCPYLEGHRVAIATYDGDLVGHHNVNMNSTTINKQKPVNISDFIIVAINCVIKLIFAPIAIFFSLSQAFAKEDIFLKKGAFPDGGKYTRKYGRYSAVALAIIIMFYAASSETLMAAFVVGASALSIISFNCVRQAANALIDFQTVVNSALVKAASDDQAKRKAVRAQTAAV